MSMKNISKILSITISFQMMIAPISAEAQSTASTILGGLQQATQAYTNGLQSQNASALDSAVIAQQTTPQVDEYFNLQKMSAIPGLAQYLASQNPVISPSALNCATLRTTLNEVKYSGCSARPSVVGVSPEIEAMKANTYKNSYEEIAKVYSNYSADSTGPGQAFGVGCLQNAQRILQGFFADRAAKLDKLASDVETAANKFVEDARTDMNAIEEDTAVLDGPKGPLGAEVSTRRPDLFDYSKRFNSAACTAMFAGNTYTTDGKAGGLNAINKKLTDTFNSTGSGKYSGASFSSAQGALTTDINSLAEKVSQQAKLDFSGIASGNGYAGFVNGLKSNVSSSEGIESVLNGSFFSNVQTTFTDQNRTLQNEYALLSSELSPSGDAALALITNPDAGGFEENLISMENSIENKCLADTFVGTNALSSVMSRMKSDESSSFAMKNASNIKPQITAIMNNTTTSMARKLELLAEIDAANGSRYYLTMDNAYTFSETDSSGKVKKTSVAANQVTTPSTYFSNMIKNCQAQFRSNNINNKLTGAAALTRMRALRDNYKKLRSSLQTNLANEVKRKLLTCDTPAKASNSVAGSCTADSFNPKIPGFCVAGAANCSSKMSECSTQSQNYVNQIKADRTTRVNNYKSRMEVFRTTLNNMMEAQKAAFLATGNMMNGLFGAGFNMPTGFKTQLTDKYLDGLQGMTNDSIDGPLLLEDPAKYATMIKDNIKLLKDAVIKQQDEIMGSGGAIAKHIENTKKVYASVVADANKIAQQCDAGKSAYEQVMAQQAQKASELGEKQNKLCRVYSMGRDNPNGACASSLEDMASFDSSAAGAIKAYCNKNGHDENNNVSSMSVATICIQATKGKITDKTVKDACEKRAKFQCTVASSTTSTAGAANGSSVTTDCSNQREDINATIMAAYQDFQADDTSSSVEFPNGPAYCSAGVNDLTRSMTQFTGSSTNTATSPTGMQQ